MLISVSVVSFNTKDILRDCLNNLLSQKTEHKIEIWVLDNSSEDGSAEMVEKEFPKVNLIKSDKNLGFAKGQNKILQQVNGELVLILNPDTQFPNNAVDSMVEFMKKYPDCGIASCSIKGNAGNLESNGGNFPFNLALLSWLFNLETFGIKKSFHRADANFYREEEVDWVGGTFMVARKEVLEKAGYFNEAYFMYFEDVELCYKAVEKGYKVMINPDLYITHQSGASSKNPRLTQWRGEFRGLVLFYKEQFGWIAAIIIRFLIYCAVILRIITFSLLGKFKFARIYTKVLMEI